MIIIECDKSSTQEELGKWVPESAVIEYFIATNYDEAINYGGDTVKENLQDKGVDFVQKNLIIIK